MNLFDRLLGIGICIYGAVYFDTHPFYIVGGFLVGSVLADAYKAYKQR